MRSKPQKGLQSIRTMAEGGSDIQRPHRNFLLLAMLELEKTRRTQEKESACGRVKDIEQRLAEIEGEQAGLLGTVGAVHSAGCQPAIPAPHAKQGRSQTATDLTITY
jgi:hypothetical protein